MQSRKFIATLFLLCVSAAALAQQKSPVAEIQEISDRIAVLEARKRELELDKQVLVLQTELNGSTKRTGVVEADMDYGTPVVSVVEGLKGHLEAVLVYRGGVRQRVREGDAVFGSVVRKVALNEVVMLDLKTKTLQRLQFSVPTTTPAAGGSAPATIAPPGIVPPLPIVPR